jgi:ATP-dependent Lon protease
MEESVPVALSRVGSRVKHSASHELLKNTDTHVRVPSAAVPKNDRSAGVAIAAERCPDLYRNFTISLPIFGF